MSKLHDFRFPILAAVSLALGFRVLAITLTVFSTLINFVALVFSFRPSSAVTPVQGARF